MGEDIISQLPDELLHHILAFISIEKVVTTSILSSRWKNLYSTNPFLTLDLLDFRRNYLLNFIDKNLVRHDQRIQRFHLKNYYTSDRVVNRYVVRWIELLIEHKIEELDLCFVGGLIFPQAILSAKSITVLHLSCGKLWETGLSTDSVEGDNTQILRRTHKDGYYGFNWVKKVKVKNDAPLKSVEIDAPSLVRFHYEICDHRQCEVKFTNCLNLRGLLLNPLAYNELSVEISTLNNLKSLKILGCYGSEELVTISSGSLTSLVCDYRHLSKVEINIPNLQYLKLRANNIILASLTAPPKREAKLTFYIPEMGIKEYIALLNTLTELRSSERVSLITNLPDTLIPDEWKEYFACIEYLTRFRNLWLDTDIGLLDFLSMVFPNIRFQNRDGYPTTILTSYTCEKAVDEPVVPECKRKKGILCAQCQSD